MRSATLLESKDFAQIHQVSNPADPHAKARVCYNSDHIVTLNYSGSRGFLNVKYDLVTIDIQARK